MKKQTPKNTLILTSLLVTSLGVGWFLMQSNASNSQSLVIPTDKFTAIQNIQQVHFNPQKQADTPISHSDKVGIMNTGGKTLGIGKVEERDGGLVRVFTLNNQTTAESSVIAGRGNNNATHQNTSIIVGGEKNTLQAGDNSVILGGESNTISSSNSAILVSSGVRVTGSGSFVTAVTSGSVLGSNSAAYAGRNILVNSDNSLALGSHIRLDQPGVFAFNAKNTFLSGTKEHTFVIKAENGMIVGTNTTVNPNVQLTVNGAIRVGTETCSSEKKGAIIAKKNSQPALSCLCLCTGKGTESISLSTDPSCTNFCQSGTYIPHTSSCGNRATTYENTETSRRQFSHFCSDNGVPTPANPSFPNAGSITTRTCAGSSTVCKAERKATCNRCGRKGFPYCFDVTFDINDPACSGVTPPSTLTCTGPTPANATLVAGDDQGLKANTPKTLVASNTPAKCEYICNAGYSYNNGSCQKIVDGKCGTNENSCSAGSFQDIADTTSQSKWNCLGQHGGASKTCFTCKTGYTLQNNSCAKSETYKCNKEDIPEFAEFYTGDDKNLTANLRSTYSATNTSRKCEWNCKDKYELVLENGHLYCIPQFKCSPNEMAVGIHASHQSDCKNKTGKDRCENAGWDGYHVAYSSNNMDDRLDELLPHEIVIERLLCPDSGYQPVGCEKPGALFLGRKLRLTNPNGAPVSYAIPTICKWSRGSNGLGQNGDRDVLSCKANPAMMDFTSIPGVMDVIDGKLCSSEKGPYSCDSYRCAFESVGGRKGATGCSSVERKQLEDYLKSLGDNLLRVLPICRYF